MTATTANATADPTPTLRARVDDVGARFLAATEAARLLDAEMRTLDRKLASARRRAEALHPAAKATAVQIYQVSSQGLGALFDVSDAMESARHAELIARAGDRTQAVLDDYINAADRLEQQRTELALARVEQARVITELGKEQAALERLLARAQHDYRSGLAAPAAVARTQAAPESAPEPAAPVATPPAPIAVPPPPPPVPGTNPHHDDPFLVCTRTRESAGDYGAVNLAGYYGAYQFAQSTWDVTASHAGSPHLIGVRPDLASPWDQDQLAWVLYKWQGKGPWLGYC